MTSLSDQTHAGFLAKAGELGPLIAAFDWSQSLGPVDSWCSSLKTTLGLILHSPVPIVLLWGSDGIMIYNDAYSAFAGNRHPFLLGSKVREGWPEVADFNDHVMNTCLAGGVLSYKDQELTLHRSGKAEQVWMNLDYSPVIAENGMAEGVIAVVVETTARVLAERRLAKERERFVRLFDQSHTFMVLLSGPEHRIEFANPGYLKLIGERRLSGLPLAEALPDAVTQGYVERLDEVFKTCKPFSATAARFVVEPVNGGPPDERFLDFVYQPMMGEDGNITGIFVEGVDVTARSRGEAALRESEAKLRAANEQLEQRVQERTLALQRSEQNARAIFETSHQYQGMLTVEGVLMYANKTSLDGINATLSDVAGKFFWNTPWFTGTPDVPALVQDIVKLVAGGETVSTTLALNTPNGHRIFDFSVRPLLDDNGAVAAIVPEALDVTAKVEAEEALRQSQKMEAVGQLTGGLAHDFNNLLTGISGSLEMLQTRVAQGRPETLGRYISAAQSAATRAASLTHRLLAFSRRQTLDPRPTDANELVSGMEDLIRRSVGTEIQIDVVQARNLWPILVDSNQLENALLNLCINARDAMPGGGRITIETCNKWLDERAAKVDDLTPGHFVALCVTDTGSGMTPDVISRAFDPFFTTKPLGEGTGLGLSMIYGFVRQSGGQIRIYSHVGLGTSVHLYLPRDEPAPQTLATPEEPDETVLQSRGELVLVVDDEPTVRMLITEVLDEFGYQSLEAADGPSAMKIPQSPAKIDLLISDVGLPGGMNGRQVADAARVLRPDLKILFITGYAETAVIGNKQLAPGMEVMTKPFEMQALAQRIYSMIND